MKFSITFLCAWMGCAFSFAAENGPCAPLGLDQGCLSESCDATGCLEDGFCLSGLIGADGLFKPSDHCFDNFISPMTNPVFFEDPRTLTEARFIFINHNIPNALFGGDAQLYAMQIRAALTDDLSLIATKDGFIVSDNPLLDDGWADVSLGLKYNLFKDPCKQQIVSAGLTYELPVGSTRALQGNGDGEFHLFVTGGTQLGENWHFISGSGFRLPANTNEESQVWYWSNHLDYQIGDTGLYLLGETNWYHWMRSGETFPVPVEGVDLFNLGSVGVAGNDIVTGAIGLKYKPSPNTEIGVAWEMPLTDREDILKDRFTFDWILRF